MKYNVIIASLGLGLTALFSTGCVTGAGYVNDSSHYDTDSNFRDKVRHLREHYARVRDEAEYHGAGRHIRGELAEINQGIDRVGSFVFSGEFIPERAQENISRLHAELREVWQEIHN